jgi:co-chaperonin GroES (HSP10)
MLNGKVAVVKLSKPKSSAILAIPESIDNIGMIAFADEVLIASHKVKVGQKICFGPKREHAVINGKDLEIMDLDNIFAIIEETHEVEKN